MPCWVSAFLRVCICETFADHGLCNSPPERQASEKGGPRHGYTYLNDNTLFGVLLSFSFLCVFIFRVFHSPRNGCDFTAEQLDMSVWICKPVY